MITINLQWLALPFVLWAIWKLFVGIYVLIETWNMPDVGRLVGLAVAIESSVHIVVSLIVAWLIYMAFRVT